MVVVNKKTTLMRVAQMKMKRTAKLANITVILDIGVCVDAVLKRIIKVEGRLPSDRALNPSSKLQVVDTRHWTHPMKVTPTLRMTLYRRDNLGPITRIHISRKMLKAWDVA